MKSILGLQCMFEVYGGTVGHAGEIIHGKQSNMVNDGRGLFKNVPSPFKAIRYHSLVRHNSSHSDSS
jgi:anthranilate/para-aminobenzoate synthase component II